MSYTFTMRHCDGSKTTFKGVAECLPEIVSDFKQFILGCGFHPDVVAEITGDGSDFDPYERKTTSHNSPRDTFEL